MQTASTSKVRSAPVGAQSGAGRGDRRRLRRGRRPRRARSRGPTRSGGPSCGTSRSPAAGRMRGHPRPGADPLAAARRLGHRDDLGAARGELRRDRQQERPGARQQNLPAWQRRPGPSPAPVRRPRSSRRAASSRGRRPGGRRRRWRARSPARAHARDRAGEHQHARLRRAPHGAAGEQLGAGGGERGHSSRASAGSERGAASATSSKRRRQIWPPGAAYSSISDHRRPCRRGGDGGGHPRRPAADDGDVDLFSSLTARAYVRKCRRHIGSCRRFDARVARCAGTHRARLTSPPRTSRTLMGTRGGLEYGISQSGGWASPRRWSPARWSEAPAAHAQTPPVIDTTGGKTQPVFGYADAIRERVFIESPYDSDKNNVKDIIAIDIKRPEGHERGPEGAGDHGPEPVLLDARARQRVAAQARLRRRRPARPVAAVLRQLVRPARLRRDPHGHDRDQQLDRLPDRPRRLRQPEREGRDRLAQRPHPGRRQERRRGQGAVAQRQDRPDRQVLRRHAGQRGRGERRRGPDARSSRSPRSPPTTTTRAPTASSSAATTTSPASPTRSPTRTAATTASRSATSWTPTTATRTATTATSGPSATTSRTSTRSRRASSSPTACRTRTSAPTTSPSGGTA